MERAPLDSFVVKPSTERTPLSSFDQSQGALAHSQTAIDNLRKQAQEAQVAAQQAQSPLGVAKETAKGTMSQLATGPIRALRSGIDFLGEKLTGKKPEGTFTGFAGEPVQTYQAQLEGGAKPLGVAGEAAFDVASMLPVGKGIQAAKMLAPKVIGALGKVAAPVLSPIKSFLTQRAEKKAVETLTRELTPTVLKPTEKLLGVKAGEMRPAGFKAAGVDPIASPEIGENVKAVQDVAQALGQKGTDIIQSGVAQGIKNENRLVSAIKNYSERIVRPFIQKSGAQYNFKDLQDTFSLVKPSQPLEGEALSAYKRIGERLQQTIANKLGKDVKDIRNLAEFRGKISDGRIPEKVLKGDEDFWDARKILDEIVQEETKGKAFGDKTLQGTKAAYEDYRRAFAQYLSDAYRYPGQMQQVNRANEFLKTQQVAGMDKTGWYLPTFEKQFGLQRNPQFDLTAKEWETMMGNLSKLYDAKNVIAPKAAKEVGKTYWKLFKKEHPTLIKAAGIGATGVGLGSGFQVGQGLLGE